MEYCITSLDNLINSISKPFHSAQKKKIIRSIAEGINFLHNNDIMHRDIKPSNVFIDFNSTIKIGDFGSSRILNTKDKKGNTPLIGTKWYKAPEIIMGWKDYNKSIDIWSFGCLFAELILLEPIFPGGTDFEMINFIFNFLGYTEEDKEFLKPKLDINLRDKDPKIFEETFDDADPDEIDLIKRMLVINPKNRITISEILSHDYLKPEDNYKDVSLPL
jgi:cell division cycle 2-like protein